MSDAPPQWPAPDCRAVRAQLGLSQSAFAAALSIPTRTVQDWEQGQRTPSGPAATLLRIVAEHPFVLGLSPAR